MSSGAVESGGGGAEGGGEDAPLAVRVERAVLQRAVDFGAHEQQHALHSARPALHQALDHVLRQLEAQLLEHLPARTRNHSYFARIRTQFLLTRELIRPWA